MLRRFDLQMVSTLPRSLVPVPPRPRAPLTPWAPVPVPPLSRLLRASTLAPVLFPNLLLLGCPTLFPYVCVVLTSFVLSCVV
jgi:hypothetical protein